MTENKVKVATEQPRKRIYPKVVSVITFDCLRNHPSFQGLTGIEASIMSGWACVLRVELFPLKIRVWTPRSSACDLIWKQGHSRCNLSSQSQTGIGRAHHPTTGVLTKRGILDLDLSTGRTLCKDKGRDGRDAAATQGCWKVPGNHQKLGKGAAWNAFTTHSPQQESTLLTPGFWTWTPEL